MPQATYAPDHAERWRCSQQERAKDSCQRALIGSRIGESSQHGGNSQENSPIHAVQILVEVPATTTPYRSEATVMADAMGHRTRATPEVTNLGLVVRDVGHGDEAVVDVGRDDRLR